MVKSRWFVVGCAMLLIGMTQAAHSADAILDDPLRPVPNAPFQIAPRGAGEAASAALPRLSMIVRNARQHVAVIDGRPRHVGEQWDGYRLLAIHPSSVLLGREGGEPLKLDLLSGAVIKKPVQGPAKGNLRP
jgi:hypothetical protein